MIDHMDPRAVGEFIKTCRLEKSMRQTVLAELASVSTSSISLWENGAYSPQLKCLIRMMKALEVNKEVFRIMLNQFQNDQIDKIWGL